MGARQPAALATLLGLVAMGSVAQEPEGAPTSTIETPLVEQTRTRLAQVDVSVTGPQDVVAGLGPEDFRLKVHMRWIEDFALDRDCERGGDGRLESPTRARRPAVGYLFYFDQLHLTLGGRARAMDVARELVGRLVGNGDRAMIASSARRLEVIEEFTDDPALLLAALDRLEHDRTQWDFYATEEDDRVAAVVDRLESFDSAQAAASLAKTHQREELAVAERSLRRLATALAPLSGLPFRKAVIYFGDTLRQNPGEHYLTFFGNSLQHTSPSLGDMASEAFMTGSVFDRMINEAAAHGTRFYTVYARGLVTPFDLTPPSAKALSTVGTVPSSARTRFRDAQSTLGNMASETGGHAFLRGESATRIAEQIREDHTCVYTLSFDPAGFPEDDPLRVIVKLLPDGVRAHGQGRIVLQSESARRAARLLGAFAVEGAAADLGLGADLVPTGFADGSYSALLQISVPATGLPGASWELGASLIHRDRVLDEVSGSLSVREAGVPLVLEHEIRLRPGAVEIVAVAREQGTDFLLSEHLRVSWPDPDDRPLTCGPLALLQPAAGGFVRGGSTRTTGSLARAWDETVDTELPTALLGLVCRDRRPRGLLRIERTLVGQASVDFPALQFDLDHERCAQVRDLIPAGSLGPGHYRYEMRVYVGGDEVHATAREFLAARPGS